ncbi:MAG: carboxypeptidase-like regulatory domain-containing protein, partial [Balneolaceae bacterium]|nr:carboxypeptidase-like regulatory domain-containing protein [Balneolaceae bacterium]
MIKKLLSSGLFCVLFSSLAFAQFGSITGTITDDVTGEELPGANVYIVELEKGASTDINGNYTVSAVPNGTYNVRVTYIGYLRQDLTVTVDGETNLDIYLEE